MLGKIKHSLFSVSVPIVVAIVANEATERKVLSEIDLEVAEFSFSRIPRSETAEFDIKELVDERGDLGQSGDTTEFFFTGLMISNGFGDKAFSPSSIHFKISSEFK